LHRSNRAAPRVPKKKTAPIARGRIELELTTCASYFFFFVAFFFAGAFFLVAFFID
jgi:hypothetical protein